MARSPSRRRTAKRALAPHALVLDSDGLSKAASGDPRAVAWVARARELQFPIVVNAVTLAEVLLVALGVLAGVVRVGGQLEDARLRVEPMSTRNLRRRPVGCLGGCAATTPSTLSSP